MAEAFVTRAMTMDDAERAHAIAQAAFADLSRRETHLVSSPETPFASARRRYERVLSTDPGGCFVAEVEGQLIGAAMAIRREGLWGLSLLVVEPAHQSLGAGGALLRAAHATSRGASGRLILASSDSRALRTYQALGLELHPVSIASGAVSDRIEPDRNVREGTPEDAAMMAAVDIEVRGAAHGADIDAMADTGATHLVYPGHGYAMCTGGDVRLLAARDEGAAAALLRTAIAGTTDARVMWMTSEQQWAIDVCGQAGLTFGLGFGAVMRSGRTGSGAPYLPNGAYL